MESSATLSIPSQLIIPTRNPRRAQDIPAFGEGPTLVTVSTRSYGGLLPKGILSLLLPSASVSILASFSSSLINTSVKISPTHSTYGRTSLVLSICFFSWYSSRSHLSRPASPTTSSISASSSPSAATYRAVSPC